MFLTTADDSDAARRLAADDETYMGFVMNATRLWRWQPETAESLFALMGSSTEGLTMRERGVLVSAAASTLGDSYCSLAWGGKLAAEVGADTAAGVLTGDDATLSAEEQAMARWARAVVRDPNATSQRDVDNLRAAGLDDAKIFAITTFVALRVAFSMINDALGARPDAALRYFAPTAVVDAVDWGRPIEDEEPTKEFDR